MANHPSADKRHRQSLKRRTRNRVAKSAVKTAVKTAAASASAGKLEEAKKEARAATKLLDKAAVHGVLHKNNAKRRIARLHRSIAKAAKAKA